MKTIKYFTLRLMAVAAIAIAFALPAKAQVTPFTYFKTSQRNHLAAKHHEQIFYLPDGSLLETTIGNLVLEIDGQLHTPPANLPILDGIYRRHLLETGQVEEKLLTLKDLELADQVYACNALRGLYPLDFTRKDS